MSVALNLAWLKARLRLTMPDQVPEEVKEERFHRFMQLQQQLCSTFAAKNRTNLKCNRGRH